MGAAGAKEIHRIRRACEHVTRQRVCAGETIEIEGGMGERLFFRVVADGLVQIRWARRVFALPGGGSEERAFIVIDSGPHMAKLEPDHELYEGFREVLRGN